VVELARLFAQQDTGDDGGSRRTKTPPERDGVLDVDMGLDGEAALVVTTQDVEGDAGEQVDFGVEADIPRVFALALVRDPAVERVVGLLLGTVDGDMQLQVHGQGQADDVEAGPDICARAGRLDNERLDRHCACSCLVCCSILRAVRSFLHRSR